MIYSISTSGNVRRAGGIPHEREFLMWKSRLSTEEYSKVREEIEARIADNDINTSSWLLSPTWESSPLDTYLYQKACCKNEDAAALFGGLIVWDILEQREDAWAFGRYEIRGQKIRGLTYFKIRT